MKIVVNFHKKIISNYQKDETLLHFIRIEK